MTVRHEINEITDRATTRKSSCDGILEVLEEHPLYRVSILYLRDFSIEADGFSQYILTVGAGGSYVVYVFTML